MTCPRILVTGDREWFVPPFGGIVYNALHALIDPECPHATTVIEGSAEGADTAAYRAAIRIGALPLRFPVSKEDWRQVGPASGAIRNSRMLTLGRPHVVLAFHDRLWNESKGTLHMVRIAARKMIPVFHFNSKGGINEVVYAARALYGHSYTDCKDGPSITLTHIADILAGRVLSESSTIVNRNNKASV